jgi:hypothetical protein
MRTRQPNPSGIYRKEAIMRKIIVASLLAMVFSVAFGAVANAEMAKEGTSSGTCMYSDPFEMIPLDKDHTVVTYENKGVCVSDTGKGPFHNMSLYNVGTMYFEKGVGRVLGYITLTDPDGDKVLIEYKEDNTKPPPGMSSGTGKYLYGTGKFAGIEGTMEYKRWYVRPATKDTTQQISKTKGAWKIP